MDIERETGIFNVTELKVNDDVLFICGNNCNGCPLLFINIYEAADISSAYIYIKKN